MDLGFLDPWLSSFMDVKHRELIMPWKAWIHCNVLPISLWYKTKWEKIIKEWGTFSHLIPPDPLKDDITNPLICILIHQVKKIKKTFEVLIGEKSFWIIIKEAYLPKPDKMNVFSEERTPWKIIRS